MNRAARRAQKFHTGHLTAKSKQREKLWKTNREQKKISTLLAESAKERLAKLIEEARPHIQRELDATLQPDFPQGFDLTVLIIDGHSVFTELGPPELKSVPDAFLARIVRNDELLNEVRRLAPPVVPGLESKRCSHTEFLASSGHIRFLASNGSGNVVGCTKCSLNMEPTP